MLCSPAAGGAVAAARSSPSALQTVSPPKGAPRWTGNCWSCSLSAGRESQTHEPSLRTEQNLLARQPSAGSNTRNAAVNCRGKQEALGQVGPWIHSSRHGMGAQSRSRCRKGQGQYCSNLTSLSSTIRPKPQHASVRCANVTMTGKLEQAGLLHAIKHQQWKAVHPLLSTCRPHARQSIVQFRLHAQCVISTSYVSLPCSSSAGQCAPCCPHAWCQRQPSAALLPSERTLNHTCGSSPCHTSPAPHGVVACCRYGLQQTGDNMWSRSTCVGQ